MGLVFFEYGTALHLALLTAAPLFLQAVCHPIQEAMAIVWLSVFAFIWIVMNPAQRMGEWPRDARRRIGWELVRNPFLSFCVVALVFSAIRAVNGGVDVAYNAQSGVWYLHDSAIPLLPGSVTGQGVLPFAGLLGLAVVTLGVRHALGVRARYAYLLMSATLAALAAAFWWYVQRQGGAVPHLAPETATDPFSAGSLLGVFFIFALVAWIESCSRQQTALELLSAFAAAVLLSGILLCAPTYSVWAFGIVGIVTLGVGIFLSLRFRKMAEWFRVVLALAIILSPIALIVLGEVTRPALWPIFPDGYFPLRSAATSVALEAMRESTRLGVGTGAYPLAIGFFATPENWKILTDAQTAVPNGWIQFLFERGILGSVVLLAGLAILLRDAILRYVRAGSHWSLRPVHLIGLLVLVPVAAVLFFECSFMQIEALMPVGAALALAAAALPDYSEAEYGR